MADPTTTNKIPLWTVAKLTNAAFVRYTASALAPIAAVAQECGDGICRLLLSLPATFCLRD